MLENPALSVMIGTKLKESIDNEAFHKKRFRLESKIDFGNDSSKLDKQII